MVGLNDLRAGATRGGGRGGGASSAGGREGRKLLNLGLGVVGTGGGSSGDSMSERPPVGGSDAVREGEGDDGSGGGCEDSNETEALDRRPPGGLGGRAGPCSEEVDKEMTPQLV